MTRHDPMVRIRHMLDHSREASAFAAGRTRSDLDDDRLFSLAMVRLLEIVGEAASRVPQAVRDRHPEIPWQEVADLRNRLIHGYDSVNHDILWDIVTADLPPLIANLESILNRA